MNRITPHGLGSRSTPITPQRSGQWPLFLVPLQGAKRAVSQKIIDTQHRPRLQAAPYLTLALMALARTGIAAAKSSESQGTPLRNEHEIRIATQLLTNAERQRLFDRVLAALKTSAESDEFQFPRIMERRYLVQSEFKPFVFKDIYFDTLNMDLLHHKISYRLRYRWSSVWKYFTHQFFPVFSMTYPIRSEVQFKNDYRFNGESRQAIINESRFEFRNASHPFSIANNAPPPPWPQREYIEYAAQGLYKEYRMKPMADLRANLPGLTDPISPSIENVMQRDRLHLDVANPWGSGPNPDQVLFVSFDSAHFKNLRHNGADSPIQRISEIEIEIDRSVLVGIEAGINANKENAELQPAHEISVTAYQALLADTHLIKRAVQLALNDLKMEENRPLDSKYSLGAHLLGMVPATIATRKDARNGTTEVKK